MFEQPISWLKKHWWGLIVAHFLILVTVFLLIWQFAEPLGIPDNISRLPSFATSRVFLHLLFTLIIGSYITLALDLMLRKSLENENFAGAGLSNSIKSKVLFASEVSQSRIINTPKTKFEIGEKVHIHITWFGLEPNRQYVCSVEIYRNTNFIHQFQKEFIASNSSWITVFHFKTHENANSLGTHRVHINLDGVEKAIENFYLFLPIAEGDTSLESEFKS
ncbi:MAG: hypothetical protein KC421_22810 [Anaerolineales bacterium]|nr:hypothetical protein [Anaerolineales bacterium]